MSEAAGKMLENLNATGGPAFPSTIKLGRGSTAQLHGMTLRDYFAGQALNGMLAHATRYKPRHIDCGLYWHAAMSKEAYEIADAMLKESSK